MQSSEIRSSPLHEPDSSMLEALDSLPDYTRLQMSNRQPTILHHADAIELGLDIQLIPYQQGLANRGSAGVR